MACSTWPDERLEALKVLVAQGLSASEIGNELGITRNAVIGKAHRACLALRRAMVANEDERKRRRNAAARTRRQRLHNGEQAVPKYRTEPQPGGLTDLAVEIAANPVTFAELAEHHCRWPVGGEGHTMLYCGADAVAGLPYCSRHCWMAYRAPERRSA